MNERRTIYCNLVYKKKFVIWIESRLICDLKLKRKNHEYDILSWDRKQFSFPFYFKGTKFRKKLDVKRNESTNN